LAWKNSFADKPNQELNKLHKQIIYSKTKKYNTKYTHTNHTHTHTIR